MTAADAGRADIRRRLGLRPIINVSGTMTALGASIVVPEAICAVAEILPEFVEITDVQRKVSAAIAQATGAEAGCVTASASAGISLAVAGCMTGADLGKIEQLPDPTGMKDEVVVQLGHMVGYGAPLEQAIRLTGGRVVPVGQGHRSPAVPARTSPHRPDGGGGLRRIPPLCGLRAAASGHLRRDLPCEGGAGRGRPGVGIRSARFPVDGHRCGHLQCAQIPGGPDCGHRGGLKDSDSGRVPTEPRHRPGDEGGARKGWWGRSPRWRCGVNATTPRCARRKPAI